MRLFLSAATLRRARILLLKATHLPLVGLIMAYESHGRYGSRQMSQPPPTASTSSRDEVRPASFNQSITVIAERQPQPAARLASTGRERPPPRDDQARRPSETREPAQPGSVYDEQHQQLEPGRFDVADLIQEMARLRTQVDRLATTLAAQPPGVDRAVRGGITA